MSESLLLELLTEELPPKLLARIGAAFADGIRSALVEHGLAAADGKYTGYAAPRRIAVLVDAVAARQADRQVERKGPTRARAFDASGAPTPALTGFARSCGVAVEALTEGVDDKGNPCFLFRSQQTGAALETVVQELLPGVLAKLPVAKVMRWGDGEAQFVRPVHGLVALHGARVLPVSALGFAAGDSTLGHRFLSSGPIRFAHASQYAEVLESQGKVIAHFGRRREQIRTALDAAAAGSRPMYSDALLDEIAALVEWPRVYAGEFSPDFLGVPQECLILSMQQHQKYVPLCDASGRLLPRFLLVSNLDVDDASAIVHGNERVLRARLSDAKFFYEQDRKTPLAERVPKLAAVVYHNRLGSQLQRVERLCRLAAAIARHLDVDPAAAERAAYLCKADLLTDMVGEFPELQGLMGSYYARLSGEGDAVADAIEAHYHPRFANDTLPGSRLGATIALAEKTDTLVGIFGIGQTPTGDKDPFGLRRQALGVVRILSEQHLPLDLVELLQLSADQFEGDVIAHGAVADLHGFVLERLRNLLRERDYPPDEIDAVLSQNPTRIDLVVPRLDAVREFRKLPEAQSLAVANKRIRNILRKTEEVPTAVDPGRLVDAAERDLHGTLLALAPRVDAHLARSDYRAALLDLASARAPVDRFFDDVMVMADDAALRANRLALLRDLAALMSRVADISKLAADNR